MSSMRICTGHGVCAAAALPSPGLSGPPLGARPGLRSRAPAAHPRARCRRSRATRVPARPQLLRSGPCRPRQHGCYCLSLPKIFAGKYPLNVATTAQHEQPCLYGWMPALSGTCLAGCAPACTRQYLCATGSWLTHSHGLSPSCPGPPSCAAEPPPAAAPPPQQQPGLGGARLSAESPEFAPVIGLSPGAPLFPAAAPEPGPAAAAAPSPASSVLLPPQAGCGNGPVPLTAATALLHAEGDRLLKSHGFLCSTVQT